MTNDIIADLIVAVYALCVVFMIWLRWPRIQETRLADMPVSWAIIFAALLLIV